MVRIISSLRICCVILVFLTTSGLALAQDKTDPSKPETDVQTSSAFETKDMVYDPPPGLQTELPQMKPKTVKTKKERKPLFDLGFLAPFLKLAFYVILALILVYLASVLLSSIVISRRNRVDNSIPEELPDVPKYQPDEKTARVLLEDADKLAEQGKYEQAVHLLLYRSIQDIENRRPHQLKRSLTAREIAELQILTERARQSFALIGRLVERSFFGGRPLNARDYEASKTAYKAFAFEKVRT